MQLSEYKRKMLLQAEMAIVLMDKWKDFNSDMRRLWSILSLYNK